MKNMYFHKKSFVKKNELDSIMVVLDNGEYFTLHKKEVVDYNLVFLDKLMWFDCCACPVAKSGYIKLRINNKPEYNLGLLHSYKECRMYKKGFIEQKILDDCRVVSFIFTDKCGDDYGVLGNYKASLEDDCIVIRVVENDDVSFQSNKFSIQLNPIRRPFIEKIKFKFDGEDSFEVFQEEIEDIQLTFDDELIGCGNGYIRSLKTGYIRLSLTSDIIDRKIELYDGRKNHKKKHLENKLVKKGKKMCTITDLYINYNQDYIRIRDVERIDVKSIPISRNGFIDCEIDGDLVGYAYISGFCERIDKNTIVIRLGKLL